MIKLIIFDWDDVIILGSKEGYYNCYRETLLELGVVLDEKEMDIRIRRKWGQPFKTELKELLIEKPDLLDQACDVYQKHKYGKTFIHSLREVVGVNNLLNKLRQKYMLAVATANQQKMLSIIIDTFGIPNVFSQIITAHDKDIPPDKTKPHPYMLQLILEKHKIKPSEAIYIGDAENDVLMARNAGVEPIVVLTGHLSRKEAEMLGVKHILPDVTALEQILT